MEPFPPTFSNAWPCAACFSGLKVCHQSYQLYKRTFAAIKQKKSSLTSSHPFTWSELKSVAWITTCLLIPFITMSSRSSILPIASKRFSLLQSMLRTATGAVHFAAFLDWPPTHKISSQSWPLWNSLSQWVFNSFIPNRTKTIAAAQNL